MGGTVHLLPSYTFIAWTGKNFTFILFTFIKRCLKQDLLSLILDFSLGYVTIHFLEDVERYGHVQWASVLY
jgi:hypothetical protein